MHVFFKLAAAAVMATGLVGTACSDAPTSGGLANLRRSAPANDPSPAASAPRSATPGKPSSNAPVPPTSSSSPKAPAPDAGTAPGPAPQAGTCVNPQCLAAAGVCGCKATDANGALVVMGCQDGVCSCTGATDTDFEGDCNDAADAKDLFFANCGCQ